MLTINRRLLAYNNILKYQEDDDLDWLTSAKVDWGPNHRDQFLSILAQITGEDFIICDQCGYVERNEDSAGVQHWLRHKDSYTEWTVCWGCFEDDFRKCDDCGEFRDKLSEAGDDSVCQKCIEYNYFTCDCCGGLRNDDSANGVGDDTVCNFCLENYYTWCEACQEYRYGECGITHECSCEAPHMSFMFPNNVAHVHEDERFTLELPAGIVDQAGVKRIMRLLYDVKYEEHWVDRWGVAQVSFYHFEYSELESIFNEIGYEWQGKRGNLTKRLSSALYKKYKVKLPAEKMTEIGNIARQHSADSSEYHIELTRDLNLSAGDFYHEDSCWWGCYAESRCALKSWGGIGMRSYDSMTDDPGYPEGRAWVQPLNADMKPTHDAKNAAAYVVYNGYGEMNGYTPARIVAQMTGMTYKKVTLGASPQYVNNSVGYLVADAETCAKTDEIRYYGDKHDKCDADELAQRVQESWERLAKLNEQYAGLSNVVEMFSNQITDNLSSIQIGVMA